MSCKMREIINYCFIYDELSNVVGLCHLWELLDHCPKGRKKPEEKIQQAEVCFSQRRVQQALLCGALYHGNLKNAFVQEKHCLQPWTSSERGNILFGCRNPAPFTLILILSQLKEPKNGKVSRYPFWIFWSYSSQNVSGPSQQHVYATEVDRDF